jgi:hypothetical protein
MIPQRWTLHSLPAWLRRIDPVAWFPVAAMLVSAVLAVVMENFWWAVGFTAVAAGIVALEAALFGPAWERNAARHPGTAAEPAHPPQLQPSPVAREPASRPRPTPRPRAAQPRSVGRAQAAPIYR